MKMIKRILALALTGALALTTLTACGSSSGSSTVTGEISYDSSRIAAATKQFAGGDAKIVLKNGDDGVTVSTHNGMTYYKSSDDEDTVAKLEVNGTWYLVESTYRYGRYGVKIDPAYSFAYELDESERDMSSYIAMLAPEEENIMNITAGTMNFNKKEYYSETVLNYSSSDGIALRETFLFDGNTPKYILVEAEGIGVFEISAYTSSVETKLFELPEDIKTEDDFREDYDW